MIPSGIETIDRLYGGIRPCMLTEIFGENGTGKTQLCLQICVNHVVSGGNVLFHDTTGEFRPERMLQILETRNLSKDLLDRVTVARLRSTSEQIEQLTKLKENCGLSKGNKDNANYSLIIVDNITDLFSFEFVGDKLALEKTLRFMKYLSNLSSLAIQKKIHVVFTNMVRNVNGIQVENMQKAVSIFTHFKIFLEKRERKYRATTMLPFESHSFEYQILKEGIFEIPQAI